MKIDFVACCLLLGLLQSPPEAFAQPKGSAKSAARSPAQAKTASKSKTASKTASKNAIEECNPDGQSARYYEKYFSPNRFKAGAVSVDHCESSSSSVCPQEKDLVDVQGHADPDDTSIVPPECVRFVMEKRPNACASYFYTRCSSEEGSGATRCRRPKGGYDFNPAPEITDGYVNTTREALVGAAKCLGEDPRYLFSLFGHESSFQINVGNTTHDWGAAQINIYAANLKAFAKWYEPFRDKPECAKYSGVMNFDTDAKATPCLFASAHLDLRSGLPVNPLRSFLVGGLFFKSYRGMFESLLPGSTSRADRSKILRHIALAAYNGGPSRVSACLRNFAIDSPSSFSSYDAFARDFTPYMRAHFGEGVDKFDHDPQLRQAVAGVVSAYPAGVLSIGNAANSATHKGCAI